MLTIDQLESEFIKLLHKHTHITYGDMYDHMCKLCHTTPTYSYGVYHNDPYEPLVTVIEQLGEKNIIRGIYNEGIISYHLMTYTDIWNEFLEKHSYNIII